MRFKGLLVFLAIVIVAGLTGCDGSSSSSSSGANALFLTRNVQGVVADGPIKGALVVFHKNGAIANVCGSLGGGKCQAETDEDGAFTLELNIYEDADALTLVATNGQDTETHVDFNGITLKAKMSWFSDQGYKVVISPITTFLAVQSGDRAAAEEQVRQALGLGEDADLYANPSSNQNLHNASVLLALLAAGLRDVGVEDDIFEVLEQRRPDVLVDGDGKLISAAAAQIFPDDPGIAQKVVSVFGAFIDAGGDAQAVYEGELVYTIASLLKNDENYPSDITEEETKLLEGRAAKLAEKLIEAAGDDGIPLDGYHPGQVCRYALFIYFKDAGDSGLSPYQVFMSGDDRFSRLLSRESPLTPTSKTSSLVRP